jgi:hypothetical protein
VGQTPEVAPPSAPPVPRPPDAVPAPSANLSPPTPGEAHRSTLPSLDRDPLLRAQASALHDHFTDAHGPFALQKAELAGGRMAALVSRADESDPLVLVVDRDQLLWSKKRPTAGIVVPALHPRIAPRPDGGVALFVYVAALRHVAARMWADDGNAFAEIDLGAIDACDALAAAYAPGRGWITACASATGTRAQRLRENGTVAWGSNGATLSVANVVAAEIAFDSPTSFVLVERARAIGGDRVLALRFDDDAQPLWPAPVELGTLGAAGGKDLPEATVPRPGFVRVALPGRPIEVDSSGHVRTASP